MTLQAARRVDPIFEGAILVPRIDSVAAWRGTALFDRDDWLAVLDDNAVRELEHALIETANLPISELNAQTFVLPTLSELLLAKRESLECGSGLTLIRGLPIEKFADDQAARLLFGLTSHIGTPLSQSTSGTLVFPVRDERLGDSDPKARGPSSRKRLSYHTDRCDVIAFLCVRQAKQGGENYVVSSVSLYNEMSTLR